MAAVLAKVYCTFAGVYECRVNLVSIYDNSLGQINYQKS